MAIHSYFDKDLFLCEGTDNLLRLIEKLPDVGCVRTSLSDIEVRMIAKFRRVILMMDGNEEGREATKELVDRFAPYVPVSAVMLPEGIKPWMLTDEQLENILLELNR